MPRFDYAPTPTDGSEILLGTDDNDTIDGLGGRDFIVGGAGEDSIDGGAGRDYIRGGSGNDNLSGGDDRDVIRGDTGNDTIDGGAGNDLLTGDGGADSIDGGAGNDTIAGGSGNDTLTGGAGEDTFLFIEDFGNDTITDFDVSDDLIDLSMVDMAIASFSDLTITQVGNDVTIGHTDFDGGVITLTGVTATTLSANNFSLPDGSTTSVETDEGQTVSRYEDPFEGNERSNIMADPSEGTRIVGKGGADVILAGEGDDSLEGGADDDMLLGEEGNDTLVGGTGDDWLAGGSGNDTFVFEAGHGNDTIQDFTDGEDMIDLSAFNDITGFTDLTITNDDGTAVIDLSSHDGGEIRLEDFDSSNLSADDFAF